MGEAYAPRLGARKRYLRTPTARSLQTASGKGSIHQRERAPRGWHCNATRRSLEQKMCRCSCISGWRSRRWRNWQEVRLFAVDDEPVSKPMGAGGHNALGRRPSPTNLGSCFDVHLLPPYLPAVSPPAIATCRNPGPGNNSARRAARRPPPPPPRPRQAWNGAASGNGPFGPPPYAHPHGLYPPATPLCPALHFENPFLHSHNLGCTISK